MVKDIFRTSESELTYSKECPFRELLKFADDCKGIVKLFHNHHAVEAKLAEQQKQESVPMLAKPVPIHWGSLQQCFQSLFKSEKIYLKSSLRVISL